MKSLLFTLSILLFSTITSKAQIVYKSADPEEANIHVFVTNNNREADLYVYEVDKKSEAKKFDGHWYVTLEKDQAKHLLYFLKERTDNCLLVYYCEKKEEAGWKKPDKKHIFDKIIKE